LRCHIKPDSAGFQLNKPGWYFFFQTEYNTAFPNLTISGVKY
jgi:hypothetical protein